MEQVSSEEFMWRPNPNSYAVYRDIAILFIAIAVISAIMVLLALVADIGNMDEITGGCFVWSIILAFVFRMRWMQKKYVFYVLSRETLAIHMKKTIENISLHHIQNATIVHEKGYLNICISLSFFNRFTLSGISGQNCGSVLKKLMSHG